jgi:hypothetical protein
VPVAVHTAATTQERAARTSGLPGSAALRKRCRGLADTINGIPVGKCDGISQQCQPGRSGFTRSGAEPNLKENTAVVIVNPS